MGIPEPPGWVVALVGQHTLGVVFPFFLLLRFVFLFLLGVFLCFFSSGGAQIGSPDVRPGAPSSDLGLAKFVSQVPSGCQEERYCGWTKSISQHLANHEKKPLFVGIYRETILLGFARCCEMDFVHPQDPEANFFRSALPSYLPNEVSHNQKPSR